MLKNKVINQGNKSFTIYFSMCIKAFLYFGIKCLLNNLSIYTMIYGPKRNVIRQISSCFFILLFKEFLKIHAVCLDIWPGGGGESGTLGAQRIIIIDANCFNFHIVETSELLWGSNSTCLGSAGSLKRSPNPRFTFVHGLKPIPGYGPVIIICFLVSCGKLCIYTHPVKIHNMTLVST